MKSIQHHVTSLDIFRGLAVAAMIVVNNPGDWNAVYAPLMHAHWDGFTLADAVFPSFVFIVGAALPFAFARRLSRSGRAETLRHIARRTLILIALGLVLNLVDVLPHVTQVRLPGVLQRIALAYAIGAPVVLLTDVTVWAGVLVVLLGVHAWLLLAVPFTAQLHAYAAGTMTPEASLPAAVDAWLLGPSHMLMPTLDPEGIVGTLSTVATMLAGSLAGAWLRATTGETRRVVGLALGGAVAVLTALAGADWLPLNKSLWTPTFAMASAGVAALVFAACYVVVDVLGWRRWTAPFLWLGVNPLAIYFLSELARHLLDVGVFAVEAGHYGTKDYVFWRYLNPHLGSVSAPRASLLFALAFTGVWIGAARLLYRKGIRIRI